MNNEMLELFVRLSALFRARFQEPLWKKYSGYLKDPVKAMLVFLEGYAFERQGRNPAYSHAAVEATRLEKNSPQAIWSRFSALLCGQGLNRRVNPLYHTKTRCQCVWCMAGSSNIIATSKEHMDEGRVKEAWDKVESIRGVGPKIASLFLRDVAVQFGLSPARHNRWLLQPVDVWVRRGVALLSGHQVNDKVDDEDAAKWLVTNCTEPELANMGLWYFAAQIAGCGFRLEKSLNDLDYARKIYREHVANLKATVKVIEAMED